MHEGHPNGKRQRLFIQSSLRARSQPPSARRHSQAAEERGSFLTEKGRPRIRSVWTLLAGNPAASCAISYRRAVAFSDWSGDPKLETLTGIKR